MYQLISTIVYLTLAMKYYDINFVNLQVVRFANETSYLTMIFYNFSIILQKRFYIPQNSCSANKMSLLSLIKLSTTSSCLEYVQYKTSKIYSKCRDKVDIEIVRQKYFFLRGLRQNISCLKTIKLKLINNQGRWKKKFKPRKNILLRPQFNFVPKENVSEKHSYCLNKSLV